MAEGSFMKSSHPQSKPGAVAHELTKTCYMPANAKVMDPEPTTPPDYLMGRSTSLTGSPAGRDG